MEPLGGLPGNLLEPLGHLKASGLVFGPHFGPRFWAQLGQEPFPASLFRLLSPPRALQEAFQRLSEGIYVEDAIWNQFWTGFESDFGAPGPLKIRFSCETYCTFCDFACFSRGSILDPILDPPGLSFGSFLAPKMVETCLGVRLGPPKTGSRLLFIGSKR